MPELNELWSEVEKEEVKHIREGIAQRGHMSGSNIGSMLRLMVAPRVRYGLKTMADAGDMALGKKPFDPVKATEATMMAQFTPSSSGGMLNAGLGFNKKRLLKEAGAALREAAGETGFRIPAARNIMKGIQGMPETLAERIKHVKVQEIGEKTRGRFIPGMKQVEFSPWLTGKGTPIHENTHIAQFLPGKWASMPKPEEKAINYRTYMNRNIKALVDMGSDNIKEKVAKISDLQQLKGTRLGKLIDLSIKYEKGGLYKKHPWEIGARRMEGYKDMFHGKQFKSEEDLEKFYMNLWKEENDVVLKKLKKDAPKLYERARQETNKNMRSQYGRDWFTGMKGLKRVNPDA
jgi:hypothetical protein